MFDLLTASPVSIAVMVVLVAGLVRLMLVVRARRRARAARLEWQRLRRIEQHQREYDENELGPHAAIYLRWHHEGPEDLGLTGQYRTGPAPMSPSPQPEWPEQGSVPIGWNKLRPLR